MPSPHTTTAPASPSHGAIGFASGRRSEALLARECPELPETARIQAADFFAFALAEAAKRGFSRIVWGTFGGKLVKMAQGLANTHVKASLTGPSLTLIVDGGRIQLGTWQGVFLCEWDGPRNRSVWAKWLGASA